MKKMFAVILSLIMIFAVCAQASAAGNNQTPIKISTEIKNVISAPVKKVVNSVGNAVEKVVDAGEFVGEKISEAKIVAKNAKQKAIEIKRELVGDYSNQVSQASNDLNNVSENFNSQKDGLIKDKVQQAKKIISGKVDSATAPLRRELKSKVDNAKSKINSIINRF